MKRLIYFSSPWCGPCKAVSPVISAAQERHPGVEFIRVDVSQDQVTPAKYQIQSVPSVIIEENGRVLEFRQMVTPQWIDEKLGE